MHGLARIFAALEAMESIDIVHLNIRGPDQFIVSSLAADPPEVPTSNNNSFLHANIKDREIDFLLPENSFQNYKT
jgi:hypothetical protein